jgi:hypothetical protein
MKLPGTIVVVHAIELASLMGLGRPFDGFVSRPSGCRRRAW